MPSVILLNKPFQVLSQFTDDQGRKTLADFLDAPNFRVAGRLDYDSEGLLLLTDNGRLQQTIANPRYKLWKSYWVQVEGTPEGVSLQALREGVTLNDGTTLPAKVRVIPAPPVGEREPPIRVRKSIPDTWLELSIREGKNRQVRRMTAHVGHPTLRLVRAQIGDWSLETLAPGEHRIVTMHLSAKPPSRKKGARK